jgi:hypothetical protein
MNNKTDALDNGPFFHGTKAELKIGDLLELNTYQITKIKNRTIYILL